MRIIAQIPHPKITISIFSMNDKYILKMEAGPMEQSFKFLHTEVAGVEGLKELVDEEFMTKVMNRFNEMFISYREANERYQQKKQGAQ